MGDIVIGGRRPGLPIGLRGVAIAAALVLVCLLVAYFIYQRVVSYAQPEPAIPRDPLTAEVGPGGDARLVYASGALAHRGGVAALRMSGDPARLGAIAGRLLGDAVSGPSAALEPAIRHAVPEGGFFASMITGMRRRWRFRFIDDGIPGHQLVEIAALLRGARASAGDAPGYESFVRHQAALDVGAPPPWTAGAAFRAMTRSLAFVAPVRGDSGDRVLIGRSLALPGAGDGGDAAAAQVVVSFVRPDGVIPFASVGWPGLVGVMSGINAEGVAVMVCPVATSDIRATRTAQPMPLLARDVLERARTLDDAIEVLSHAKPLGAAAYLVVDGNQRAWAIVERSPTQVAVVRNPKPAVVTDLLVSNVFAEDPEVDRARRTRPSAARATRVKRLLRTAATRPEDVAAVLRDRRGPAGAPLATGHRGAVHDAGAVHTAIFDASAMILWVAEGADADTRMRAFDLRHELRGEGAQPTPPADLPAADSGEIGAAAVRASRRELRAARRTWRGGDRRRARELVQRALVRTPDLPEALALAGDIARAAGDWDSAEAYYRRYLAVGPDDRGAEEAIRAMLDNR